MNDYKTNYEYAVMRTAYHYCVLIVSLVVSHCFYGVCWLTTRPNVTTDVISVYTCSKYIRVLLNDKMFVHISVSMFALKEYALDHIGKKRMPICRICDPPRVSQTGLSSMLIMCAGMGGLDKYKCHYEGCTKELKSLSGFQNHIFYHEEDKKKWQCNICKQKFTFESQLSRHQIYPYR